MCSHAQSSIPTTLRFPPFPDYAGAGVMPNRGLLLSVLLLLAAV